MIVVRYHRQLQNYLPIFFNVSVDYLLGTDSINSGDINTKETARDCINKQLTLLNVEEQNRLIWYIDGILDSKKGK